MGHAFPASEALSQQEISFGGCTLTAGVDLRDVTEADLPLFFAHQLDPDAARMAAFPSRARDAFMAHWARVLADDTVSKQTILVAGQVAGNIVCFAQDGQPHVGYWIGREYWGRGVATAALCAFLVQVAARPLYARAAQHNIGSIRVLEKCGFTVCAEAEPSSSGGADGVEEVILRLL